MGARPLGSFEAARARRRKKIYCRDLPKSTPPVCSGRGVPRIKRGRGLPRWSSVRDAAATTTFCVSLMLQNVKMTISSCFVFVSVSLVRALGIFNFCTLRRTRWIVPKNTPPAATAKPIFLFCLFLSFVAVSFKSFVVDRLNRSPGRRASLLSPDQGGGQEICRPTPPRVVAAAHPTPGPSAGRIHSPRSRANGRREAAGRSKGAPRCRSNNITVARPRRGRPPTAREELRGWGGRSCRTPPPRATLRRRNPSRR